MSSEAEKQYMVFMTAGSEQEALAIGRALVEGRLAACCSLMPRIRSIYRWKGEVCDEPETLLLAKTVGARLEALIERVREVHSYECPEVVALEIGGGFPDYLQWLAEECSDGGAQERRE